MTSEILNDYLDLVDAARDIGIHPQSLRRLVKQRKIPARMFAGKYLFSRHTVQQFSSTYDPRPGRKRLWRLM